MSVGILGTKLGMTQVFDEAGKAIPVTVIQAGPCTVTQVKSAQTDGYSAIQVGYGDVSQKALSKPELGHLAKSGASPARHLREYRLEDSSQFELGSQITVDSFSPGQIVDVIGTSIGRGLLATRNATISNEDRWLTVLKIIAYQVQQGQVLHRVASILASAWRAVWVEHGSRFAN